jgi:response regulator RpfG family c-di-GMP phosphodiesterase
MPAHLPRTAQILITDSDADVRAHLVAVMKSVGHSVRTARGISESLAQIAEWPPDLVMCGVDLPRGGALALCRRIKGDPARSNIAFVLYGEMPDASQHAEALEAGVDDLLDEPMEMTGLLARIRALVRAKLLSDEVRSQQRIIDSLLAISTLNPGYADASTRVLANFARRTADLLRARQVAVLLKRHQRPPEVLACWPVRGHQEVVQKISTSIALGALLAAGEPLVVEADDRETQSDLGLREGFVGVPVADHMGEVIGAVLAFGTPERLRLESVRTLMTLAQRIGAEIQLEDHRERLEAIVTERTRDLEGAKAALERANEETIFRLALAAECRDDATAYHLHRIARFSELLARAKGFDSSTVKLIRLASMLHDIGKLGIRDEILQKPGKLTPEEYEEMKRHTLIGAQICAGSDSPQMQMSERIALGHHEWWNGKGYPHGRSCERIPVEARIVAVGDIFDALISERPYKKAWSLERAFEHIASLASTQLDPALTEIFLQHFTEVSEIAIRLSANRSLVSQEGSGAESAAKDDGDPDRYAQVVPAKAPSRRGRETESAKKRR